jgi:antitoxin component YwqK of YwqJK toxin-antitoxin module
MKKSSKLIGSLFLVSILITNCNQSKSVTYSISSFGDTLSKTVSLGEGEDRVYYYDPRVYDNYVEQIITYKDSLMHGMSTTFHSNGKIKSVVEFKNGKIWNVKVYQDSSENKLDYGLIENGNGRLKIYWKDLRTLKKEGGVVNGFKEDYWYSYCGDGEEICDSTLFSNGRDEFMQEWESSGNPFFQQYD